MLPFCHRRRVLLPSWDGCLGALPAEAPGSGRKIRRKAGKAAIFSAGKLNVKMEQKLHI